MIYMIVAGTYSDFHVVGLFSTEEKAQAYMDAEEWARADEPGIEEWDIDPEPPEYRDGIMVWMDRHGEVLQVEKRKVLRGYTQVGYTYRYRDSTPLEDRKVMHSWVETDEQERAIKVTNERRVKDLAEGIW